MRFFTTGLAGLMLFSGGAFAEPLQTDSKQPAPQADSQPRPANMVANIVLASADPVRGGSQTPAPQIKRKIVPRVTACRCAGPAAAPDPEER